MEKKNLAIVGGLGALAAYLYYARRPCELCETCETSCEFSCQTCEISQDVPDHCARDNPDWKHDDQIYDVTSIMNSQGYSGYWELDVLKSLQRGVIKKRYNRGLVVLTCIEAFVILMIIITGSNIQHL